MMKMRTIHEWGKVFGVTLEDFDGFPNFDESRLISLTTFLGGVESCCLRWDNINRMRVMYDLLEN
jgi:hypothetical protein